MGDEMVDRLFWLSFVGSDGKNRGCCIVEVNAEEAYYAKIDLIKRFPNHLADAEWIAAAISKAHKLGCNPGGEVTSYDITGVLTDKSDSSLALKSAPRHVLMQREEMQKMKLV